MWLSIYIYRAEDRILDSLTVVLLRMISFISYHNNFFISALRTTNILLMHLLIHYIDFQHLLCRNKIVIQFSPVYFVDLYVKSRYLDLATSHKFPNRIRIFFESSLDSFCIKLDDMELAEMFDLYIRHTSSFLT